ncbi:hypothetical protein [Aeromonas caviae]|uniref:hypothetical protein n=1 Tax=Aeromonas caviae TaxID=648 RepID=UPI0019201A48|nr:hypothetical protein [Aeromonas caviae]MBL0486687.1 hypothetical protein [Aeromonas caviae]
MQTQINETYALSSSQVTLEFSYDAANERQKLKISGTDENASPEEQFFIFEVSTISPAITESVVEIKDDNDNILGLLITGTIPGLEIKESPSVIVAASVFSFIKNNSDLQQTTALPDNFEDLGYDISKPLLLVVAEQVDEYINFYMDGCELWGGFSHQEQSSHSIVTTSELTAYKGIRYPTAEQRNKILESVTSNNPFDRFLKKYQLLELLYDYILIAKLRSIDPSLSHFRHTMNSYTKDECDTLKDIINNYVSDVSRYLDIFYDAHNYEHIVVDIFKRHSKDSNPLKDDTNWGRFWSGVTANKLSFADMINENYRFNKDCRNEASYKKSLNNIAAYWIYRVRCSIAHYKIGEFIFNPGHEIFLVRIAERLIDEVLYQVFSSQQLHDEISLSKEIDQFLIDRAAQVI